MSETSNLLSGLCPGSHLDIGVRQARRGVICQTCNRLVQVNRRGIVHSHYWGCLDYLDTRGDSGELEYTGREDRGSDSERHCYFGFALRGWGTDRVAARMAAPLHELKRLHEFLGSAISDIEQECASNPRLNLQVNGADATPRGPTPVY